MRIRSPLALLTLVSTLMLLPSSIGAAPRVVEGIPLADPTPTGEADLQGRIFFSANLLGEFEPCSCPDRPLGGIAQAAALVEAARGKGTPVFWLDSGDRLFRFDMAMTGQVEAERRARSVLLVDAGNAGGLDALGLGRLDLGSGLDYLRRLAVRAAFPMLSANLVDDEGNKVFKASILIDRGGRQVGITSVLPSGLEGRGYRSTDPIAAAKAEVRALRAMGADLVVVLSNLGIDEDSRLARASRADLVLSSHSRELTAEGRKLGRVPAGEPGSRGRYLGDARWYRKGPDRGPGLVVTTQPVYTGGAEHPQVRSLVEQTLKRLTDPSLGLPPISFESFEDPAFREREKR
ncbi:MAG: hypothetical protein VX498_01275 [Myxococcota bacterium]|nr:hypothetical protein [Myxococcota bacterium]